jgi:hypothetical protein
MQAYIETMLCPGSIRLAQVRQLPEPAENSRVTVAVIVEAVEDCMQAVKIQTPSSRGGAGKAFTIHVVQW